MVKLRTKNFKVDSAINTNIRLTKVYTLHLGRKASFLINNSSNTKLKAGSKSFIISDKENLIFKMPIPGVKVPVKVYGRDTGNTVVDSHNYHAMFDELDLKNNEYFNEIEYLKDATDKPEKVLENIGNSANTFANASNYAEGVWKFDYWQQYDSSSYDSITYYFKPVYKLDKVRIIKETINQNYTPNTENIVKSGYSDTDLTSFLGTWYVPPTVVESALDVCKGGTTFSSSYGTPIYESGVPYNRWPSYNHNTDNRHFIIYHGQNPSFETRTFSGSGYKLLDARVNSNVPDDGIPTFRFGNVLTVNQYSIEANWGYDKCCSNSTSGIHVYRGQSYSSTVYTGNTAGTPSEFIDKSYEEPAQTEIGAYFDDFEWSKNIGNGTTSHKQTVSYVKKEAVESYDKFENKSIHPKDLDLTPADFGCSSWQDVLYNVLKRKGFQSSYNEAIISYMEENMPDAADTYLRVESYGVKKIYEESKTYSMDFYVRAKKYMYSYSASEQQDSVATSNPNFLKDGNHPNCKIVQQPSLMYENGSMDYRNGILYEWQNRDSENGSYFEAEISTPFVEYAKEQFKAMVADARITLATTPALQTQVNGTPVRTLKSSNIVLNADPYENLRGIQFSANSKKDGGKTVITSLVIKLT